MSNYTKATNFASKDSLLTGNPLKIVKGTEIDNEFNAISTAISTKFDTASLAAPGPIGATTPAAINGTTGTFSGNVQMASANGGQLAGLRNKIINGSMQVSQRNAGSSFNITTTSAYTLDRWQGQTTGSTVTGQQAGYVSASGLSSVSYSYSVTGAASNTGVFLIQRIEAKNCRDLAGQSVTLSLRAYVSGAAPTSFNWALRYATVTDTFTSVTAISNGTFTLNTTDNSYSATISVPAAATTGLELLLSTGAFTSGSLFFTNVQLEPGPVATPFEQRPYGMELALCQRYYTKLGGDNANDILIQAYAGSAGISNALTLTLPVSMRASPTAAKNGTWSVSNCAQPAVVAASINTLVINTPATVAGNMQVGTLNSTTYLTATAEL